MFDEIRKSISVDLANLPMEENASVAIKDAHMDQDLTNPYGKISCLVLYLYSMEFGQPPLYYEINRVCRTMDESKLQTLGPYIKALGIVTACSEKKRDADDQIKTG